MPSHSTLSKQNADDAASLRRLILTLQREGSRRLNTSLRPHDLTALQAEILVTLRQADPLSLGELAGRVVCNTHSPSRAVDDLVRRGAIRRKRSAADRRRVLLRLTSEGQSLALYASVAFRHIDDLIHQHLSKEASADAIAALQLLPTGTRQQTQVTH